MKYVQFFIAFVLIMFNVNSYADNTCKCSNNPQFNDDGTVSITIVLTGEAYQRMVEGLPQLPATLEDFEHEIEDGNSKTKNSSVKQSK